MSTVTQDGFLDITDPDNYVERMPWEEIDRLRETHPVYWHEDPSRGEGAGFWLATRYWDVVQVSRHPEIFSSREDGAILQTQSMSEEERQESLEQQRMMMLNMDPPDHTKLRSLVQRAFTPRTISRLEDRLRTITNNIVDRALEKEEGNFVEDVAAELPLEAIAELMGVPSEDRRKIFDWSNRLVGADDPDFQVTEAETQEAQTEMFMYANSMAEEKKACPADDLVSKLLTSEVDGDELSELEFDMFFMLLSVAGNETTRNAISHGLVAFHDYPEQWELFKRERPSETMADEVVRWATPVMHFQRTALQDTEVGGQPVKQGERVAINYASANRDLEVFDDPYTFDITRDPNPHIGFGGGGPHFCLGANLARLEIQIMFETIADRMPNLRMTGEPRRLRSMFINGIKEIPARYVA